MYLFLRYNYQGTELDSFDIKDEDFEVRGMFEINCLFLSGDFKFQVSPKVLISCPRSTPRG